jgi:GeoRSP system SPASM domain protein
MNLNNLNVPIIVHWDVRPNADIPPRVMHTLSDDLASNKILVLHIWDSSPALSASSMTVMEKLKNTHMNITLTVPHSALDGFDMEQFLPALRKVLIHYENLDQIISGLKERKPSTQKTLPVGISFFLNETTWRDIPGLLKICVEAGIKDIHFPIQRPESDQRIFSPDEEVTRWLSKEVGSIKKNNLNINIHDPFLWALFNNGMNGNTKGCQAAHTMIYISGNLDVTPCPLLPIVFGNLQYTTLTEVFLSGKRRQFRTQLLAPPRECMDCERLNRCLGGCRGRAYMYYQTFDKRDPACHYL